MLRIFSQNKFTAFIDGQVFFAQNLSRLGLVGGFLVLVVLVGFTATTFNEGTPKAAMLAAKAVATSKSAKDSETLAATILTSVLHSSPQKLMHILRTWKDNQIANLDSFDSKQVWLSLNWPTYNEQI